MLMAALRAVVKNGRLVLNQATDLPEGTVVELAIVDDQCDQGLRRELERAAADEATERLVDFDSVIAKLGAPRGTR
jgi:hypothetical protein